jgi:hypothetical protein
LPNAPAKSRSYHPAGAVKADPFDMRAYWPDQAVLDGTWKPPVIARTNQAEK